jgi:hypothetical protein
MSTSRNRRLFPTFLVIGVLPALGLVAAGVYDGVRIARERATDALAARVEMVSARLDFRLGEARQQFEDYVDLGFARLSTQSIVGRPGFGIVEARLRATSAVIPLRVPFERVAILAEDGEALWLAGEADAETGSLRFAHVETAGAIDTTGVARAARATGETRVERVGDSVRFFRAFDTDPYDTRFVVVADLPAKRLIEELDAATETVETAATERFAGLEWEFADQGGGDAVAPSTVASRLAVNAAGDWPDDVWTVRAHSRHGIAIAASLPMRQFYDQVVREMRFILIAVVWLLAVGGVLLIESARRSAIT